VNIDTRMDTTALVRYSSAAVLMHWLVALALVGTASAGLILGDLPEEAVGRQGWFDWHRWLGVSAFVLILVRLVVRALRRPPPALVSWPRTQRLLAHGTHAALYLLMVAAPISGYLLSNRMGEEVILFGALPLPSVVGADHAQMQLLERFHLWINYALMAVAGLHIVAALKHHLVDRDATLRRMWFG
jgi:cytochrome b561